MKRRHLPPVLLAAATLAFGCAPSIPAPSRPPPPAEVAASAPEVARTGKPLPAHKARPAYPERKPTLAITTPMKGEPTATTLAAEARLVASSCEKANTDDADARVRAMRVEVDRSFKEWHDQQPSCWQSMREDYRIRKELEKRGNMWGNSVGDAFGAGGLGLSGVGQGGGGYGLGSIGTIGHGAGGHATSHDVTSAARASGTNNQVASVDEADIVKTDGKYVYLAANGAFRIIEAMHPRIVSQTPVEGTIREIFVEGDRAVVYASFGNVAPRCTYGYDCQFAGDGSTTKVSVFDLANRASPRLVRDVGLSGSLVTARRIGSAIHTVVADNDSLAPPFETWPTGLDTCGTPEATVRARFAKLRADNERQIRARSSTFPTLTEKGKAQTLCGGIYRTALRDGNAFTTVVSFDLNDDRAAPTTATLQSRPGAVFASANALYVAVTHRRETTSGRFYSYYAPNVNEVSEIHKFRIGAEPKSTRYTGSGTVPGHVLNQFAMDEWYGYLRVATTRGQVPDPNVASVISVLAETKGGDLTRIGAIDKIAPGEDIRSVRFEEDRGYIVTFKKTDPLFVVDLFDPTRPAILGELKIPGFSTYMHRIDPDHLLSIGFDANDHGSFAYFDGVILQLFDVKNPTRPTLIHKEKIGTRGSSSQAATDHLAFNYFASEGRLAIPMTICEGGGDGSHGDKLAFSGLLVYDVDLERGFTRLGGVDHGKKGVTCQTWWSSATSAVKRSVFLDDLVYSIAGDRVKVQNMNRFGLDVADFAL